MSVHICCFKKKGKQQTVALHQTHAHCNRYVTVFDTTHNMSIHPLHGIHCIIEAVGHMPLTFTLVLLFLTHTHNYRTTSYRSLQTPHLIHISTSSGCAPPLPLIFASYLPLIHSTRPDYNMRTATSAASNKSLTTFQNICSYLKFCECVLLFLPLPPRNVRPTTCTISTYSQCTTPNERLLWVTHRRAVCSGQSSTRAFYFCDSESHLFTYLSTVCWRARST